MVKFIESGFFWVCCLGVLGIWVVKISFSLESIGF